MDALILSCGTGGGHNSAGKAILEELEKRGHHAVMMNPYDLKSSHLSGGIDKTYVSTVQSMPRAFGAVYQLGNLYRRLPFRSPVYFVNYAMVSSMAAYLAQHRFDVVVMTHLFPAEILTNMKQHGIPIPKTIFVATDYVCTPFTEETDCDAYIVPAADLIDEFVQRGIPKEKVYPLGIPTHSKFLPDISREEAKKLLGLDIGKRYILITGGSMGGGKIETAIQKIQEHFAPCPDIECIIVCGSNQALYQKLLEQHTPKTHVVGHTDQMALYMKASDLFITKPGGLSSTEGAVCGVPMLHTSAIPGCESYNARYFSERGMSLAGSITDEVLSDTEALINDASLCKRMIDNQKKFISAAAAKDICDLAEGLSGCADGENSAS